MENKISLNIPTDSVIANGPSYIPSTIPDSTLEESEVELEETDNEDVRETEGEKNEKSDDDSSTPALPTINFRRVNFTNQSPDTFMTVIVDVLGRRKIEALLDTGARINLMTISEANKIGVPINKSDASEIYGIGGKKKTERVQLMVQ